MCSLRLWLSSLGLDAPSLIVLPELEAVRSELGCLTRGCLVGLGMSSPILDVWSEAVPVQFELGCIV